jgi:hypothetical protein
MPKREDPEPIGDVLADSPIPEPDLETRPAAKADEPLRSVHLERMDPRDLVLLERNARFMRHETYKRLVDNVKRDGMLTSVPFALRMEDGRYEVRSGNHRVMAAIDAGLDAVDVMCCDDEVDANRALAIQISHNSITGEDDPAVLKELYDSIDDVDWREFTGLDDKVLDLFADIAPVSLSEANLQFTTITLIFLPDEADEVTAAFEEAQKAIKADGKWLARQAEYNAALDALATVGAASGVKNQALTMKLMVELAQSHLTDLRAAWWDDDLDEPKPGAEKRWIPLAALFGVTEVPAGAAGIIQRAVDKMCADGELESKSLWRALELWAADYLAGA